MQQEDKKDTEGGGRLENRILRKKEVICHKRIATENS